MCEVLPVRLQVPAAFPSNEEQTLAIPSRADFWHTYAFKERLGSGQFGEVWRCVERSTGKAYACKEVEARTSGTWRRVCAEIECMRALSGHSNIVHLHEVHREGESIFIVMDLCDSKDLFEAISATTHGLGEEDSRDIFRQLVEGVAHCHGEGFIHRDIKPENVLLHRGNGGPLDASASSGFQVKLADFGLAHHVTSKSGVTKGRCGSPQYAAPEVKRGREYSYPADIWSLGVLLYAMLQADWPELDRTGSVVLSDKWRDLSFEAQDLLARMLMAQPEFRPTIHQVLAHPWIALPQAQ